MQRRFAGCALGALTVVSFFAALRAFAAPEEKAPSARTIYQYACGQWSPEEPKPAQGLVDVLFSKGGGTDDPPTQAQLDAITAAGGKIVHAYHVPMVRARLRIESVGLLAANTAALVNSVTLVKKNKEHPVDAQVRMDGPLSDADRDFLEDVGAVVVAEFGTGFNAIVPDEAIPAIRSHAGVELLEVSRIFCPQ